MSSSSLSSVNRVAMLLCLVILENASVLVTRYTRSAVEPSDLYDIGHLMLVTESAKLLLATILEVIHTKGNLCKSFLQHNIRTTQGIKVALPAMLYFLQNTLFYVALSSLPSPVFQVTYQMKLLMTAFVSVIILGRSYSWKHWICLIFLTCGVAAVALAKEEKTHDDDSSAESSSSISIIEMSTVRAMGLVTVFVASVCSALAGVLFEKFLKSNFSTAKTVSAPPFLTNPSMYMRNIQLAAFSILCALVQQAMTTTTTTVSGSGTADTRPYLHGFSAWVWLLVVLRSSTGLLVASIIKYTDNVIKGIASGVSVLVGVILAMFLFGTPLNARFAFGAALVLPSTYLFSNDLPDMSSCSVTATKFGRKMAYCFPSTYLFSNELPDKSFRSVTRQKFARGMLCCFLILFLIRWQIILGLSLSGCCNYVNAVDFSTNDNAVVKEKGGAIVSDVHRVPENHADELHFAVVVTGSRESVLGNDCGGCKMLWGLHDALQAAGYSVGGVMIDKVPCDTLLEQSRTMNRTQVIVYPETAVGNCNFNSTKQIVQARWILAPV